MWPRFVNLGLGAWLMAAGTLLGYDGAARTNDVIVGAIAASMAVVAVSEVMRPLRWVNGGLGAWLVVAPWLLGYAGAALVNSTVVGVAMVALSAIRGRLTTRFGGGWKAVMRSEQAAGASRPAR